MNNTPNGSSAPPEPGAGAADTSARGPEATGTVVGPGAPGLLEEFSVLQKLGEGGMGAVYLAEDVKLKRKVAIKMMRPELAANKLDRDRFVREARAAAAVEHDHIVPILRIGEAPDGTPFIVMPFLKGEMLDARLKREPAIPFGLVLKVAGEVADGLAAAHAAGLIHRDIKPGNIWLEGDPTAKEPVRRCKILDFGLARSVEKEEVQLTASGAILGTPAYMAPEQARGEKVDPRADLFSLGATLYRMVTGRLPFDGPTPMAVLIALTTETPKPVRELAPRVPSELAGLIDRLMHRDRERRPRSAAEVVATVRAITEKLSGKRPAGAVGEFGADPISTSQPQLLTAKELPEGAPPAAKRGRWPWVLAAVALFALVPPGLWLAGAFGGKAARDVTKHDDPPGQRPPKEAPKAGPAKDETTTADPDRAAARYVFSVGGCVCVDDKDPQIATEDGLPKGPFRLTAVALTEKEGVTDAGLAVFAPCRHLTSLGLSGTKVSDAGLAHFTGCKNLMYLYLEGTRITSAGLAHLKDRAQLLELNVGHTMVDDTGLAHLKGLARLAQLFLKETSVTAAGVADLAKALPACEITWDRGRRTAPDPDRRAALWALTNPFADGTVHIKGAAVKAVKDLPGGPFELTGVDLTPKLKGTELQVIPNAELAVFKGCKNLTGLYLVGTGITNAGLAHFADSKGLTSLYLSGTKVNDGAADTIKRFTKLTDLVVGATDLTEKGVWEIAAGLPGCRIQYGYTIEPASDADRKAAERVLAANGRVSVNWGDDEIAVAGNLPAGPFRLTWINFPPRNVEDADLEHLGGCKSLAVVSLANTTVTDASLSRLSGCANLTVLRLNNTRVGDAGLAHLKDCRKLEWLDLSWTQVSDAGLAHHKGCERLMTLWLANTEIGDAGLETVKRFTNLVSINLVNTKVTQKGVTALAKALPGCTIAWDGGVIAPTKK